MIVEQNIVLTSSRSIILVIWEYMRTRWPSALSLESRVSSTYSLPASMMSECLSANTKNNTTLALPEKLRAACLERRVPATHTPAHSYYYYYKPLAHGGRGTPGC